MDHTFVHFDIPADDVERAKTFYEKLFGWKIVPADEEGFEGYWYVMTSDNDEDLHGGLAARGDPSERPIFTIAIENLDEALARVEALGGTVITPKMEVGEMGYAANFRDPEGNIFGLWEARSPSF